MIIEPIRDRKDAQLACDTPEALERALTDYKKFLPPTPGVCSGFTAHAIASSKFYTGLFECLLHGASRHTERFAFAAFEIPNGSKRHADLLRKVALGPVKQPARGAALSWRDLHAPSVWRRKGKSNRENIISPLLTHIDQLLSI